MGITLSRHSKNNMKLYKIVEKDVLETIKKPDMIDNETGKKIAVKRFTNKFSGYPLKVVYTIDHKGIFIVTTYPLKKKEWR